MKARKERVRMTGRVTAGVRSEGERERREREKGDVGEVEMNGCSM